MSSKTKEKEMIQSVNPATGETLGEIPVMDTEEVKKAVDKAWEAQEKWAAYSLEERADALKQLIPELIRRKDHICKIISQETGKPMLEALTGEIFTLLEAIEWATENAPKLLKPRAVKHRIMKTVRTYAHYEPHGVVGTITPWNYPFMLTFIPAISCLVAGNAVVAKPSEFTTLSVLEIEKIFNDLGFPEGLFQVVTGYGATGEALIRSGVKKVIFTGSVATGRKVASLCGELLIPVTVELGGKDPMIVLEDAPLDRAVKCATWAGFCNSGQICSSVERIYVHEKIYDQFAERLKEEVSKLRQGEGTKYDIDLGPMNNDQQYDIVADQVEDAKEKGATVLFGGEGEKPYYKPTVLADLKPNMKIYAKETFGPVVPLAKIKDAREALERANDSSYGLTASIWSENTNRAEKLARELNFGSVFINDHLGPSGAGEVSWGGFEESGFGKTRGPEGLLNAVRVKYVSTDLTGMDTAPFWYPYTQEKYERFSEVLEEIYGGSFISRIKGLLKLTWLTFRG